MSDIENSTRLYIRIRIQTLAFLMFIIISFVSGNHFYAIYEQSESFGTESFLKINLLVSILFYLFCVLLIFILGQFVVNELKQRVIVYEKENLIEVFKGSNKHQIVFSDIRYIEIKQMGKYRGGIGGYIKIELKNGTTFFITSLIVDLDEMDKYLRIASSNKVWKYPLLSFLPFKA